MKSFILLFICLSVSIFSHSQSVFLKNKPSNEKTAVSFTEATTSIMFFGAKSESSGYKNHRLKEKEVNAYFGPVYTNFPIFDIGKENIVEYSNENGHFFFYQPNAKKDFGMVISNGKEKPILVTNPDLYLKTIKTYLNIANADYLVPKTLDARNEKTGLQEMQKILESNFIPSEAYASKLIKNANTNHYSKPFNDGSYKMSCNDRVFEMFSDSLMTQKSIYGALYRYDDKNQMTIMNNTLNGKENGYSKYERFDNGLIKMIISGDKNTADTTKFIYEKDKYYTVSISKGVPYSYDTFFLNDQFNCVRSLSKRSDQSIMSDITFIYDKFGRKIREGKIDSEMIYHYNKDSDQFFSGFSSYSKNPTKLEIKNEVIREKNINTFIGRNGAGDVNFKSVTYTAKDGSTKTYSYDQANKLTSVSITRCL